MSQYDELARIATLTTDDQPEPEPEPGQPVDRASGLAHIEQLRQANDRRRQLADHP